MTGDQIHRAVSADGTEIAGRVQGQGPPLVLVHGPVHDGDIAWGALLPLLTDRFTCYLPSLRGRGLSGDNPDHSPPRSHFQEDVNAFVDSIGEPVYLMGWSDGGSLALGAAAHSDAVAAVAAYEPAVWTLMREDDLARFGAAIEQATRAYHGPPRGHAGNAVAPIAAPAGTAWAVSLPPICDPLTSAARLAPTMMWVWSLVIGCPRG